MSVAIKNESIAQASSRILPRLKIRFIFIAVLLGVIAFATAASSIFSLYRAAITATHQRLVESAHSQARIIDAMARSDGKLGKDNVVQDAAQATLGKIRDAYRSFGDFGDSSEFVLGKLDGEKITFLLRHRFSTVEGSESIPLAAARAEPMRRALSGSSGIFEGLDYRGVMVLAAYMPIDYLNWGLVAKIDLSEVGAPFVRAAKLAALLALMLVFLGIVTLRRLTTSISGEVISAESRGIANMRETVDALIKEITQRKSLEGNLLQSERRLRSALRLARIGYWERTDIAAGTGYFSEELCEIYGVDPEQIEHSNDFFFNLVHRGDRAAVKNAVGKAIKEGVSTSYEFRIVKPDGEIRHMRQILDILPNSRGGPVSMRGVTQDISDIKEAQNALILSEQQYQKLIDNSPQGIIIQRENRIIYANQAQANMHGFSIDELIGMEIGHLLHPDQSLRSAKLRSQPKVWHAEIRCRKRDGSEIWLNGSELGILWDGKPARLLVSSDITEQRRADRRLRESEERYRRVVEVSPVPIFTHENQKITFANEAAAKALGAKDTSRIIGKSIWKFIHGDSHARVRALMREFRAKGTLSRHFEERFIRADGKVIDVSAAAVQMDPGVNSPTLITFRDISPEKSAEAERRRAEDIVRTNERRFRATLDNITTGIVIADQSETIELFNPTAEKLFGYAATEIIGGNFSQLFSGSGDASHEGYLSHFLATRDKRSTGVTGEVVARRQNGDEFSVHLGVSEMGSGGAAKFIAAIQDMTEQKHLEEQLWQAQKLEALGTLSGGIAHEINTPIQYVGDNTRFLRDAFSDIARLFDTNRKLIDAASGSPEFSDLASAAKNAAADVELDFLMDEIPSAISQSLEGVERVSTIVQAIKEYSHPWDKGKTLIDINHAIETTITVTRNQWKYVAELETDFDPSLTEVPCLPNEFGQVILNLIVNASHAIEEADNDKTGQIKITTKRHSEFAEIRVSDTGVGIPKKNYGKIYDLFFTTKEPGKGTGQGLALTHQVITKKHGGSIRFESTVGQGTTFIINLPLTDRAIGEQPGI